MTSQWKKQTTQNTEYTTRKAMITFPFEMNNSLEFLDNKQQSASSY